MAATLLTSSLISTIEALYRVEQDQQSWLEGFNEALWPGFGDDCICLGMGTEARGDDGGLVDQTVAMKNVDPEFFTFFKSIYPQDDPDNADRVLKTQFFIMTEWEYWRERMPPMKAWGIADAVVLLGRDPDGPAVGINVFLRSTDRIDASARSALTLLTAHMASSYRICRRLEEAALLDNASAVLDPSGKVHHAEGAAKTPEAREELVHAAREIERARGPLRRTDPEEAVEIWRAMVRGDWTLVDRVESDGKRYLVARENAPAARPIPALTARETQVVALASLGHANKLIAYELGIVESTVRVLMSRASNKLGATSREELVRAAGEAVATAKGEEPDETTAD